MKTLSSILLILNPICGFFIVASFVSGYWYCFPLFIIPVILTLKFYFHQHREEHQAYITWRKEFEKENEYLGETWYYGDSVWKNRKTGEIFEI